MSAKCLLIVCLGALKVTVEAEDVERAPGPMKAGLTEFDDGHLGKSGAVDPVDEFIANLEILDVRKFIPKGYQFTNAMLEPDAKDMKLNAMETGEDIGSNEEADTDVKDRSDDIGSNEEADTDVKDRSDKNKAAANDVSEQIEAERKDTSKDIEADAKDYGSKKEIGTGVKDGQQKSDVDAKHTSEEDKLENIPKPGKLVGEKLSAIQVETAEKDATEKERMGKGLSGENIFISIKDIEEEKLKLWSTKEIDFNSTHYKVEDLYVNSTHTIVKVTVMTRVGYVEKVVVPTYLPDWAWLMVIVGGISSLIFVSIGVIMGVQNYRRDQVLQSKVLNPKTLQQFRGQKHFAEVEVDNFVAYTSDKRDMWTIQKTLQRGDRTQQSGEVALIRGEITPQSGEKQKPRTSSRKNSPDSGLSQQNSFLI